MLLARRLAIMTVAVRGLGHILFHIEMHHHAVRSLKQHPEMASEIYRTRLTTEDQYQ